MEKIIIIGSPGAGKSTFARKLRDKTGLPLYYLDRIWHKPDHTNVSTAEFDRQLDAILKTDTWIIDGNYARTLEARLAACDTVFLFDLPTETCLEGARARVGTVREKMPWVEQELDNAFRRDITVFRAKKLPDIYALLRKYQPGKDILIFHSHQDADMYLQDGFGIETKDKLPQKDESEHEKNL